MPTIALVTIQHTERDKSGIPRATSDKEAPTEAMAAAAPPVPKPATVDEAS